jgi:hypothetical protein
MVVALQRSSDTLTAAQASIAWEPVARVIRFDVAPVFNR